jgi:hypothetical protein
MIILAISIPSPFILFGVLAALTAMAASISSFLDS